jgi:large conductance mechanosensitive channel
VLKGFKNFLMQGELIVIAVGLVVALGFSTLIKAFTDSIIQPLINSVTGNGTQGLGFTVNGQFVDVGAFLSALVYFMVFMAVIYFLLVVPYRSYMAKRGRSVFGDPEPPPPVKTCPECRSEDLPIAATKCWHCASAQAANT